MDVLGNLDFKGIGKLIRAGLKAGDFPLNPTEGEFLFKDGIIYVCVRVVDDLPFWVPLTQQLTTFRFDQETPAMEWNVPHNLGTNTPLIQTYDSTGLMIVPQDVDCSEKDNALIIFGMPVAGTAICMYGITDGLPAPMYAYTNTYASSTTWVVNHGLGYYPKIDCIIGGYLAQPQSIVHDSTMQATITFTSAEAGTVRCY